MIHKLSFKMTLLYSLIIIITIIAINTILIRDYESSQLEKNELEYLTYSNVLSRLVRDEMPSTRKIKRFLYEYVGDINGRVLILNDTGVVIGDKYRSYLGKEITNKEITQSIKFKTESKGYYKLNGEYIMMVSTPILQLNEVVGVVLISTDVTHIIRDAENLRNRAIMISTFAIIVAILLSLFTSKQILKPIKRLTKASQNILKGKLNTKVRTSRKDEIGELALTFNKMSEELYKIDNNRRQFISNVSHELKTPLTSIKALIESLINGNNDIDTYNEYLTDVNDELDRLSNLVKSLLAIAKLEEVKFKKEPIRVRYLVEEIIRMFIPLLNEKNINIINNCNSNVLILADRNRFKEVIINLVDNSIKYGKANGNIEIYCENKSRRTYIGIKDDGCGIPKAELPHIFDNFYRVDKARKSDGGSSGVGLYVVKKIVELHGWKINVESQVGKGTEFTIEIK